MKVLLTGGAGYIGSHANKLLNTNGIETVVLDNLSRGHLEAVRWGRLVRADLLDYAALESLFAAELFDAVMHFAAFIFVGESVSQPEMYYHNNLAGSINLLRAMRAHGVGRFIFSSTAAVYGMPQRTPIDEEHPTGPINPYGWSKFMIERVLADFGAAYGLRSVVFRYFNAAGADPDCETCEKHDPENHLVPLVLKAILDPSREITVFGEDYATPDGTAVRDYIHVMDLAQSHLLGLRSLMDSTAANGAPCRVYNIGNGAGFTVKQVIDAACRVTGGSPRVTIGPRRAGDAPQLVASSGKLRRELGWTPRYPSLEDIIAHAWEWEKK